MKVSIEFEINIEEVGTTDELREWVEFCLGCGSCDMDNPYLEEYGELSPDEVSIQV